MIKIVKNKKDAIGFEARKLFSVYDLNRKKSLVALASSAEEALDAKETLNDLKASNYVIVPPQTSTN